MRDIRPKVVLVPVDAVRTALIDEGEVAYLAVKFLIHRKILLYGWIWFRIGIWFRIIAAAGCESHSGESNAENG